MYGIHFDSASILKKTKIEMKQLVYTLGLVLLTSASFAQKKNVQSASKYLNDAREALQDQDMVQASKDFLGAKDYIDQASEHEDTKNDPKMYLYKGQIYLEMAALVALDSTNEAYAGLNSESMAEEGMADLKKSKEVDDRERYHSDVDNYCNKYRITLQNMGVAAYDEGKYAEATEALIGAAQFGDVMGVKDSMLYYFGGLAAVQSEKWELAELAFRNCVNWKYNTAESVGFLATAMKNQGKQEEAEALLAKAVKENPQDVNVLIQQINFFIDTDRSKEAKEALQKAIDLDPDNTALVYTSGNIYEQLGQFDDAQKAYERTLELDPDHTNAKFAMGGLFFNKGADLYNEGNKLPPSDPKSTQMIEQSKEMFNKALPFLEAAAEAEPDDVIILQSLKAVYGKLGMVDKFKETKARIAELQG
jgi:tetratricopeptide (TPR) repeat protein